MTGLPGGRRRVRASRREWMLSWAALAVLLVAIVARELDVWPTVTTMALVVAVVTNTLLLAWDLLRWGRGRRGC